jgi:hypothetical protein
MAQKNKLTAVIDMIAPMFVVWVDGLISFSGESAEKPAKTKYCSKQTGQMNSDENEKEHDKKRKRTGRTGEFILFAVFLAFEALRKKSSLDFLFILHQGKRKAENNNTYLLCSA